MTRTEFAMGSAIFIAVIAAGFMSAAWVDRHFAADVAQTPSASSAACVAADGSWRNWVWANVPMLSPKCPPDR
jgi:hypothetical protein